MSEDLDRLRSAIKAGAAYFALVFLVGFVLGAVRLLLLIPRVGVLWAVLLELPVILTASWLVCGWVLRRFAVPAQAGHRIAMGAVAFVLLIAAEVLLSTALGQSPSAYLAKFGTPEGALGLAGQVVFGLFPWIRLRTGT